MFNYLFKLIILFFFDLMMKQIGYIFYVLIITLIALELVLHIYNPIPFRLKGDKIVLPIHQQYSFTNDYPDYESLIIHNKNSLGYRGEEMPADSSYTKVIVVGGSTTECFFVTENKAWPQVFQQETRRINPKFWVNNAGLNGHSTFGHLILLKDIIVKQKPDYVYFLVGVNDMDRSDLNDSDGRYLKGTSVNMGKNSWFKNAFLTLSNNSEVFNLIYNISKAVKARNQKIFVDQKVILKKSDTLVLSSGDSTRVLDPQRKLIPAYQQRIQSLIDVCLQHKITPVFITQPLLYGEGIDPKTGIDLATHRVSEVMNGGLLWKKLELYNEATRKTCLANKVGLIDLAYLLPKNSAYFFDEMHYSNEGSIQVGKIISEQSRKILKFK